MKFVCIFGAIVAGFLFLYSATVNPPQALIAAGCFIMAVAWASE